MLFSSSRYQFFVSSSQISTSFLVGTPIGSRRPLRYLPTVSRQNYQYPPIHPLRYHHSARSRRLSSQVIQRPSSANFNSRRMSAASAPVPVQLAPVEAAKRAAAYRAVKDHFPPNPVYVGIGSGSTVIYVVEAIAALGKSVTDSIIFVPTGFQSRELIVEAGLRLGGIDTLVPISSSTGQLQDRKLSTSAHAIAHGTQDLGLRGQRVMLDVAFDGADEVDEELNCIKGGGACLFQEKLVAISAKKFIVVADYRKLSPRLLSQWPTIPIEIVPTSAPTVLQTLEALGSPAPFLRLGGKAKAGPIITDNANLIIDAPFPPLLLDRDVAAAAANTAQAEGSGAAAGSWTPLALAARLNTIVGVVEVGLFSGLTGPQALALGPQGGGGQKPIAAYFGLEDGGVEVRWIEQSTSDPGQVEYKSKRLAAEA